ncbi:MAG: DNA polymerase III subunit gamma/tau [Desulfovibrionaceae bacterium]|nr:DNA polymerase III subunit gamma/tau [Desulfovibrionaceae bacterium]
MNSNKKLSLAARYRPQTFGDVAGQEMVKAVLSKACLEDRPACAYLFSGTRGVGKTTIARIFAKALNCAHAPCAEPCNTCEQCQKIMQGNHVDVVEIDGASNNKVDDVRALRETVGYSAMEGRYKIFIIDEAHMLTTPAFNALLKTLEEPPPHVVFMMATTEVHKFPVTIISRCQHFTFRHLNEDEIVAHLQKVLQKEELSFEEDAVRLIAKRAEGSVRDSMSLLDQTLALVDAKLTVALTREVLGLAGQEFFEQLFQAIYERNTASVINLTRGILRQGVDIGFFITELASHLRSLFLVAQAGNSILPVLQLTPDEAKLVNMQASRFSPAHLHAAWQLVLEAQRSVVQSTEPASALELLLLNLTLLPQLLPIDSLPGVRAGSSPQAAPVNQAKTATASQTARNWSNQVTPVTTPSEPKAPVTNNPRVDPPLAQTKSPTPTLAPTPKPNVPSAKALETNASKNSLAEEVKTKDLEETINPTVSEIRASDSASAPIEKKQEASQIETSDDLKNSKDNLVGSGASEDISSDQAESESEEEDEELEQQMGVPQFEAISHLDLNAFSNYYAKWLEQHEGVSFAKGELTTLKVQSFGSKILFIPNTDFTYKHLNRDRSNLEACLRNYLHLTNLQLEIAKPVKIRPEKELVEIVEKKQELEPCFTLLNATIERCREN